LFFFVSLIMSLFMFLTSWCVVRCAIFFELMSCLLRHHFDLLRDLRVRARFSSSFAIASLVVQPVCAHAVRLVISLDSSRLRPRDMLSLWAALWRTFASA